MRPGGHADKRNVIYRIAAFFTSKLQINGLPVSFSPLELLLRLILPLAIVVGVYRGLLLLVRRVILRPVKVPETGARIARIVRTVLRSLAALAAALILTSFFGAQIRTYLGKIWEVLTTPFVSAGSSRISIVTLILAIPIFYVASWIGKATRRFVEGTILNQLSADAALRFTVGSLARYGAMILAVLVGLSLIGINFSSLAVLFGVLGIGVGFGLQNVVANFISGLVIFLERPIKEGDRVLVNGLEGDVVQIRLRATVINTLTNETIIVPNSQFINNSIHNYSYGDRRIITVNRVQVSYATDLDQAQEALLAVAARNPFALADPAPQARVFAFQDSGILMELWTWIGDATRKLASSSWTNLEVWRELKSRGIVIPFPQVDLHVKDAVEQRVSLERRREGGPQ